MTNVLIAIAVYAAVAYVTAFVFGLTGVWDGAVCVISILWPIGIPLVAFLAIGDWLEEWFNEHPDGARRIRRALDLATLPFRPFGLGERVARWIETRRKERRK